MGIKRFKPEEIISRLRQVEILCSQGKNMADAIKHIGVSEKPTTAGRRAMGEWESINSKSSKPFKKKTNACVKPCQI